MNKDTNTLIFAIKIILAPHKHKNKKERKMKARQN